ncbi:MAG: nucleotidyl transferase AbiEii/AbiGii toxin family protein [Candidatus Omnitrophica bacterium]|nr:nucleotidyl transferase AbiEii/AbiGii toxin family protein [Candidatus Omnitrophota bacterium]
MGKKISLIDYQEKVLKLLSGRIKDFYLAGGTALSRFYFQHRDSDDLDFFTQNFLPLRVEKIREIIAKGLKKKVELIAEQTKKEKAKMMIYNISLTKNQVLRVDFVEDYLKLIRPLNIVNGIPVLSIQDIYLRKIYAIVGFIERRNIIGRKIITGRQEPKDFYDLFFLSQTCTPLSDFAFHYCDQVRREGLIRWFRTYDRFAMKSSLLDLKTKRKPDYQNIERHFKKEIDKLIRREVDFI